MTDNDTNFSDMIKLPKNKKTILITIMDVSFTAILITYYSFKYSKNVAYTAAIISSTCVFTLLLSRFFLKPK